MVCELSQKEFNRIVQKLMCEVSKLPSMIRYYFLELFSTAVLFIDQIAHLCSIIVLYVNMLHSANI